ncbi:MAG: DUF3089 domain-containing protein [Pseudomonadota bacterium]
MAKKFLYFVAFCIVAVLLAGIAYQMFRDEIFEAAFVPSTEFVEQEPLAQNAYEDPALWLSRPGIGVSDPARWQPAYAVKPDPANPDAPLTKRGEAPKAPDFAVFFVHPTSYVSRSTWNDSLGEDADAEALRVAKIYLRGMASTFNSASQIWAPRYRQATMGAFLTDKPEAQAAIDAAYADVLEAYRFFVESLDADTPIVLAGHSQGSLHLIRLLREEVMPGAESERLVAAYTVGWPISVEHDLPEMGLPACATPAQTGCVISWSSFAEPADTSSLMKAYSTSEGFDGSPRGGSTILCSNPLTGAFGGAAPATSNLGTLVPDDSMSNGELVPGEVPARCDDQGILLIGDPPELGAYVLPGNNYHVYDYPLFWANTQADVVRRVKAKAGQTPTAQTEPAS